MQATRREIDHRCLEGVERRASARCERTDSRIDRLEARIAQLSDEAQDLRRRTGHLETEVGLLPIKALIVLLWLLAVVGYAAAIGFAISH